MPPPESVILDCYNQAIAKDAAMTITTRINDCNHYFLLEMLPKEPFMYRVPYGKTRAGGIVQNNCAGTLTVSCHENNELVIEPIMNTPTTPIAEPKIQKVGNIYPSRGQGGQVVATAGLAPTVTECHGEVTRIVEEPIKVRQATKQGYIECPIGGCFDANYPNSKLRRGRVQENGTVSPTLTAQGEPPWLNEGRVCAYKEMPDGSIRGFDPNTADKRGISEEQYTNPDSIAPTVITAHEPKVLEPMVSAHPISHAHENPAPRAEVAPTLRATDYKCPPVAYEPGQYYYRIRKLHPIETYRLMDIDDPDIDKLISATDDKGKPALSKSAHYKLAGNSIVVSCLYYLLDSLFFPSPSSTPPTQLTLF